MNLKTLLSAGSDLGSHEVKNSESLQFVETGMTSIMALSEEDEDSNGDYGESSAWSEDGIYVGEYQKEWRNYTSTSSIRNWKGKQRDEGSSGALNKEYRPVCGVKERLCTFCYDISAFFYRVLDPNVADETTFDHHETIPELENSARRGCALCQVFVKQLVLLSKEESEDYEVVGREAKASHSELTQGLGGPRHPAVTGALSSRKNKNKKERIQTYNVALRNPLDNPMNRVLVLQSSPANTITLELYCDRGMHIWSSIVKLC